MDDLNSWLSRNNALCQPQQEHALRAVRHLSRIERKNLFSEDISYMRSAEGRWFEMIAYEVFLDLTTKTDLIKAVILKGADVKGKRPPPALGQDGFYYSRNGDITLRGNGQDLAEFDSLLMNPDGSLVFVEVVTSPADLKDFLQEIYYKKTVLRYLFDQKAVTFLLVTPFQISNYKGGRKVLASEEHVSISTEPCETYRKFITGTWNKQLMKPVVSKSKTCYATDMKIARPFHYKEFHDLERDWVFSELSSGSNIPRYPSPNRTATLVKKILFGRLYPSAMKRLSEKYKFVYKDEILDLEALNKRFSKAILASDLPDYTPLIYLRQRAKKEYFKMVYDGHGIFKYERKTPPKVGFFIWLESLEPELGAGITIQLIESMSRFCFEIRTEPDETNRISLE